MLFNKKEIKHATQSYDDASEMDNTPNAIGKGMTTLKDYIAPPSIDRENPYYNRIGSKYARSFVMTGFPSYVHVGWLDELYDYDGDMDVVIHIEPADEREALEELTAKITQFEAQYAIETKKGNIRNTSRLQTTIEQLYSQRSKLEQSFENLFYIQIAATLYTDTEENLNKETQQIDNKLRGKKIYLMPLYLRQDEGFKTALPLGRSHLPEFYRNFNSGALTATFPFYNSEISHKTGVFCGVNLSTMTPIFIDFYDRSLLNNSNLTVFGQAGSGKTFFVSLLTMRSALKGIRTVIIDPEGEYLSLTDLLDGSHIYISPDSNTFINPFDLEEEEETINGKLQSIVKIRDKVADVLNLIAVMAGGLSQEEQSIVASCLVHTYEERGFTEDPASLYKEEEEFDPVTGEFFYSDIKKEMPTLSDFHRILVNYGKENQLPYIMSLANALNLFTKDGIYGMFDRQTSKSLQDFKDSTIVTFDISQLEESILRPIGMYIALSWTWEKFVKKNPTIKKRVLVDEAWMLVNKNMAGSEYTSLFLEQAARRIRKRNGGLLVASQNFLEFYESSSGKAVLTNAFTKIFLKQNATDIDAVQDVFKLSDGEKQMLLQANRGEMLIKLAEDSSVGYSYAFPFEEQLIKNSMVERQNIINRRSQEDK